MCLFVFFLKKNLFFLKVILACQYKMPAHFSAAAASLVSGLLQTDPTRRLGAMAGGVGEIKVHPFFEGIDWAAVLAAESVGPLGHVRTAVAPARVVSHPDFENFS